MAIQAMPYETTTSLAKRAGVGISEFLKYNEISIDHTIMAGSYYYLARKKARAGQKAILYALAMICGWLASKPECN